jgi:hypothetical protein
MYVKVSYTVMAILDFQYISKNSKKENRRPSRQHSYNLAIPSGPKGFLKEEYSQL